MAAEDVKLEEKEEKEEVQCEEQSLRDKVTKYGHYDNLQG